MPRKPKNQNDKWVSIMLTKKMATTLTAAAESDGRSLNAYIGRVLADHASILDTVDESTRKELAVLSSLPAERQVQVLERARQQMHKGAKR